MKQINIGGVIKEADGSWKLRVRVDHPAQRNNPYVCMKRVQGTTHVGGLIRDIVETLNSEEPFEAKHNFAEYELWWPEQRRWLLKHHWRLEKYAIQARDWPLFLMENLKIQLSSEFSIRVQKALWYAQYATSLIQADAKLTFTNRNKVLKVELPNKQCLRMLVNFSADVLSVVRDICYICEIRNHTELSLVKTEQSMKAELNAQLGGLVDPIMTEGAIKSTLPFGTFRAPARFDDQTKRLI